MLRVNIKHLHPKHRCLVGDKLPELMETPVGMFCPLAFANRCLADTLQIFQGYRGFKCLRLLDNAFTDDVVGVALKSFLFARQFLQMSFGRFRTFHLQCGAEILVALTLCFHLLTTEDLSGGIRSEIDNPKVNAEHLVGFDGGQIFDVASDEQEKLAAMQYKIGFTLVMLEHVPLMLTADERQRHAPFESPEIDLLFRDPEAKDPVIVSNRPMLAEYPLFIFANLVGIGNFGNGANGDLGGEFEQGSDFVVGSVVKWKLGELPLFPGNLGKTITGTVDSFNSFPENYSLFWIREESRLSHQFHADNILNHLITIKDGIPPPAEAGGLLPCFL